MRAQELALQTNTSLSESRGRVPDTPPARRQHKRQSSSQHSIIYGGNDEPSPADRHIDPIHKGHEIQTRIKNVIHRTHKPSPSVTSTSSKTSQDIEPISALPHVSAHYLLISPLLPPLSNFLSLSAPNLLFWRHHDHTSHTLLHHPTLVIFGTKDIFTSSAKLDAWCKKMSSLAIQNKTRCKWRKVEGASHFWREGGLEKELRESVREWADEGVPQEE
jgi:hypothetical protein